MIKPYCTQRFVTDTFMLIITATTTIILIIIIIVIIIIMMMKAYIALRVLYIGICIYTK